MARLRPLQIVTLITLTSILVLGCDQEGFTVDPPLEETEGALAEIVVTFPTPVSIEEAYGLAEERGLTLALVQHTFEANGRAMRGFYAVPPSANGAGAIEAG